MYKALKLSSKNSNSVFRNSIILMIGTGLSQAIPMLFSPIMSRIFNPEQFGNFSVFYAVTSVMAIVASGLYELAIVKTKQISQAFNLLSLVQFLAMFFCLSLLLIAIIYYYFFKNFIKLSFDNKLLLLLPLAIYSTAIFNGLSYWLNRNNSYHKMSYSKLIQSLSITLIGILLGLLGFLENGLIYGLVIGNVIVILPILNYMYRRRLYLNKINILAIAKENINFPKLVMPTSLMNTLALYLPLLFISYFFSKDIVGNFSLTTRVLTAPVAIISVAIGQIYYKKTAELVNFNHIGLKQNLYKTTKILAVISLLTFIPIFFFSEKLFLFVFGNQWLLVGSFVKILTFSIIVRFIVSPLSVTLLAVNKTKVLSIWQICYFISTLLVLTFTYKLDIYWVLTFYVINDIILYLVYYLLIVKSLNSIN